jgi:hypothetical protein
MTGSHEVRGSIPLGSTNHFNPTYYTYDVLDRAGWIDHDRADHARCTGSR